MPPRFAYWTILVDDQPTAFRAKEAEELLPTFNRLKEKHPSAVMRWFQAGKLWGSRQEAQDAFVAARREAAARKKPAGSGPPRDRKWRPGGTHQDPRQKYKDARKAKWTRFKERLRAGEHPRPPGKPQRPPAGSSQRPPGSAPRPPGASTRPYSPSSRPSGSSPRPQGGSSRPQGTYSRPPWKSSQPPGKSSRPFGKPRGPSAKPWRPSGAPPGGHKRRRKPEDDK